MAPPQLLDPSPTSGVLGRVDWTRGPVERWRHPRIQSASALDFAAVTPTLQWPVFDYSKRCWLRAERSIKNLAPRPFYLWGLSSNDTQDELESVHAPSCCRAVQDDFGAAKELSPCRTVERRKRRVRKNSCASGTERQRLRSIKTIYAMSQTLRSSRGFPLQRRRPTTGEKQKRSLLDALRDRLPRTIAEPSGSITQSRGYHYCNLARLCGWRLRPALNEASKYSWRLDASSCKSCNTGLSHSHAVRAATVEHYVWSSSPSSSLKSQFSRIIKNTILCSNKAVHIRCRYECYVTSLKPQPRENKNSEQIQEKKKKTLYQKL